MCSMILEIGCLHCSHSICEVQTRELGFLYNELPAKPHDPRILFSSHVKDVAMNNFDLSITFVRKEKNDSEANVGN